MGKYYEHNAYIKSGRFSSRAFHTEDNAYNDLKTSYNEDIKDMKSWGRIKSVEEELDIGDDKMIGYTMNGGNGFELFHCVEEAEGDIEKLEKDDRFSDVRHNGCYQLRWTN